MAEIHVEKKRGTSPWVWILLLVIIVAAAVAYLWYAGYIHLSMIAPAPVKVALLTHGGFYGA